MNPTLEREFDDRVAHLVIGWKLSADDDEIDIRSFSDDLTIRPNTPREIFVFPDISDEKNVRFFYPLFRQVSFRFFLDIFLSPSPD